MTIYRKESEMYILVFLLYLTGGDISKRDNLVQSEQDCIDVGEEIYTINTFVLSYQFIQQDISPDKGI